METRTPKAERDKAERDSDPSGTAKARKTAAALGPNLTGDARMSILLDRLQQLASTLWVVDDDTPGNQQARLDGLVAAVADIAPRDEIERMLAVQIVACNEALLEAFRRAAIPEQTFEGRDADLKRAEKLMAAFARLVDTLNKHRGKGQQRVTVEHVHVNEGARAVVGTVQQGVYHPDATPALESSEDLAVDFTKAPKKKARAGKG